MTSFNEEYGSVNSQGKFPITSSHVGMARFADKTHILAIYLMSDVGLPCPAPAAATAIIVRDLIIIHMPRFIHRHHQFYFKYIMGRPKGSKNKPKGTKTATKPAPKKGVKRTAAVLDGAPQSKKKKTLSQAMEDTSIIDLSSDTSSTDTDSTDSTYSTDGTDDASDTEEDGDEETPTSTAPPTTAPPSGTTPPTSTAPSGTATTPAPKAPSKLVLRKELKKTKQKRTKRQTSKVTAAQRLQKLTKSQAQDLVTKKVSTLPSQWKAAALENPLVTLNEEVLWCESCQRVLNHKDSSTCRKHHSWVLHKDNHSARENNKKIGAPVVDVDNGNTTVEDSSSALTDFVKLVGMSGMKTGHVKGMRVFYRKYVSPNIPKARTIMDRSRSKEAKLQMQTVCKRVNALLFFFSIRTGRGR